MDFVELPDEVILLIFQYLTIFDVVNGSLVCRRLNTLLTAEQLWKKFCYRDYSDDAQHVWYAWTYKEFYTKVLHKFKYLFGSWKRDLIHYGGLIKIQVETDGIMAYDCLPPLDGCFKGVVDDNNIILLSPSEYEGEHLHKFRYRRIFCLKPVGKQVMCFCYQSMLGHLDRIGHSPCPDASSDGHSCSETCHNDKMFVCKTEEGCKFVCHQPDKHDYNLDYWFQIEHGFRPANENVTREILESLFVQQDYDLRIDKFDVLLKLCCYYDLKPLVMKDSSPNSLSQVRFLPKPGFYFGTYSAHGWEIIDVHFREDGKILEGVKITGDPNVPSGKVSFRVYLDKPLYFSKTDQLSLDDVREAIRRNESEDFSEILSKENYKQTFVVPNGCIERNANLPKFCLSRYVAEGQIAGSLFRNPMFTPCVFIAFDEQFFGILWLELQSISTYYRATNGNVISSVR